MTNLRKVSALMRAGMVLKQYQVGMRNNPGMGDSKEEIDYVVQILMREVRRIKNKEKEEKKRDQMGLSS